MEKYKFVKACSILDLKRFYPLMQELRNNLTYQNFLDIYQSAHLHDGYEIVAIESKNEILALMGYRILFDFVHGKHLYIDDLVSTEAYRSKGLGAKLLIYAEELASANGCKNLRLSTGIENEKGKQFYEKNLWKMRAVVYKKKLY
jgi:GNAT superfamily N-acetyltransferase